MQTSEESREIRELYSQIRGLGWTANELAFNEVAGSPLWIVLGRRNRTKIQKSSRSRLEAWRMVVNQALTM